MCEQAPVIIGYNSETQQMSRKSAVSAKTYGKVWYRDRAPATAGCQTSSSWVTLTPPTWLGIPAVGIEEGESQ